MRFTLVDVLQGNDVGMFNPKRKADRKRERVSEITLKHIHHNLDNTGLPGLHKGTIMLSRRNTADWAFTGSTVLRQRFTF